MSESARSYIARQMNAEHRQPGRAGDGEESSAEASRRNELCPCGSGQKWKQCCGTAPPAALIEARILDYAAPVRSRSENLRMMLWAMAIALCQMALCIMGLERFNAIPFLMWLFISGLFIGVVWISVAMLSINDYLKWRSAAKKGQVLDEPEDAFECRRQLVRPPRNIAVRLALLPLQILLFAVVLPFWLGAMLARPRSTDRKSLRGHE